MAQVHNINLHMTMEQLREAINGLDDILDMTSEVSNIDPNLLQESFDEHRRFLATMMLELIEEHDRIQSTLLPNVAVPNAPVNAAVPNAPVNLSTNATSRFGVRNSSTRRNRRNRRKARKSRRS